MVIILLNTLVWLVLDAPQLVCSGLICLDQSAEDHEEYTIAANSASLSRPKKSQAQRHTLLLRGKVPRKRSFPMLESIPQTIDSF
jgi:hypothetical protein